MSKTSAKTAEPGRNWWKIAFFVLLVVFEFTREFAVLAADTKASPNSFATIFATDQWAKAQGRWRRIDNGDALVPGAVAIDCDRARATCIEASYAIFADTSVMGPDIAVYDATWAPDAIIYENDFPVCARYVTRIDLKLKKAFQVRDKKDTPDSRKEPHCKNVEQRIEMQLGDGYDSRDSEFNARKHFVPFTQLLMAILN
jgi:hypothetical protein